MYAHECMGRSTRQKNLNFFFFLNFSFSPFPCLQFFFFLSKFCIPTFLKPQISFFPQDLEMSFLFLSVLLMYVYAWIHALLSNSGTYFVRKMGLCFLISELSSYLNVVLNMFTHYH